MKTACLLVLVAVLGCGGGGDSSCGKVQPCGGDVVGAWKLQSGCALGEAATDLIAADLCADATGDVAIVGGTAAVTFNADQSYVQTGDVEMEFHLTLPMSCFAEGGTCADLKAAYAEAMATDPRFKATTCAASGSACVCNIRLVLDVGESGTYSSAATSLTTRTAGGPATTAQYCVQGDELHNIDVDMAMPGPMGMANITFDTVFKRQ
jgi:hypothetical protein